MIFDGRAFAREIEDQVKARVVKMEVKPKIVSIVVGDDPASALYSRLKQAAAQRCGIVFEIEKLNENVKRTDLLQTVRKIGQDPKVTGVMVQLPLPENFKGETLKVLEAIPLEKDVDGLRWAESGVKPATVRAILSLVDEIAVGKTKFVVLGARGAVGRPLVYFLRERGVEVSEVEWDTPNPTELVKHAEVVISCVGKPGIVTGEMVREGVVAIDVGMSEVEGKVVGDMTVDAYQKASVAVPVPGGVGPVTIASLMANAFDLVL